ncbi:hypothetical protein FKW77_005720 [Venturia effusa]|uniref:F-box domain-containing protein n=1 Tax=Venturia effusa TaxID=50376 RepID=A0A517L9D5_9PEZI|nr:hypothetical protein FKW77_005720 [Venturia effusa]
MANLLPSSAAEILADLTLLPNLESLIVRTPFVNGDSVDSDSEDNDSEDNDSEDNDSGDSDSEDNESEWIAWFYDFEVGEGTEGIEERERAYGWRAIMSKSWDAIVQNKKSRVRSLESRQIVAKGVSTWTTQAFRDFLAPLDSFKISVRGYHNGAGWEQRINTLYGYHDFLGSLGPTFFNHLPKVSVVSLHASGYGPTGLEGTYHSLTPFEPNSIPLLKSLHLEYVFIDPPLVRFLSSHSQTLESIMFTNCMTGIGSLAENGIPWHNLFHALLISSPPKLRIFEIQPLGVEDVGESDTRRYLDIEMTERARQILEEDKTRRAFPYKKLDDKYGMLFADEHTSLEAFLEGKDQEAWDELMKVLRCNAEPSA